MKDLGFFKKEVEAGWPLGINETTKFKFLKHKNQFC